MKDIFEPQREEIRKIYSELERFIPEQDKEKNGKILEKYINKYIDKQKKMKNFIPFNVSRAFDYVKAALEEYKQLLIQNKQIRDKQEEDIRKGAFVESEVLEDKLKKAINSSKTSLI